MTTDIFVCRSRLGLMGRRLMETVRRVAYSHLLRAKVGLFLYL